MDHSLAHEARKDYPNTVGKLAMNGDSNNPSAPGPVPGTSPRVGILLLALVGIFLWRWFFSAWVNLIPDECSYWTWSRRLDWSYFDNSGMVAYLIRLSTWLFGEQTPWSVRFPFLVLSGVSTYLIYRVSVILFQDPSRALVAAVVFNLAPVGLLGGSSAVHDNALIFFWLLALWAGCRFLREGEGRWFYVMGAAAGLAIQSKYTGVLIVPCLLVFLLWCKDHRGRLFTREPWIGVLIAIACALPILWWNFKHDWASLYHVLYIGSGSPSLSRRIFDGLGYHIAQFVLVSPLFYCAMLAAAGSAVARRLFKVDPAYTLLLSFGLPLGLFGVMAFRGHVEANWGLMGYASILILAVQVVYDARSKGNPGLWRLFSPRFFRWAIVLAVGTALLVVIHGWLGILPAGIEKRIAKTDRIIWETRGWDGLGNYVGSLKEEGDVIAADSYQLCAVLEFNVPGNPSVRYLAPWKRPTQFDVWEPSFDNLTGRNILLVSSVQLRPSTPVLTTIYENFGQVEPLPSYKFMYHGVAIREMYVYRCHDFNPSSPRRLAPRTLFYSE